MSLPRPLPLGNSSFSRIKVAGQIYVDKIRLIFDLSSKKEKFLLTRPRRFGKSLLISTFESLFKFGLRDFRGLEADIGSWSLNARKEQRMPQRSWKKQFLNWMKRIIVFKDVTQKLSVSSWYSVSRKESMWNGKPLEVFDETCWRKSRLHAWLKRNTAIEKKSFCWVLIAENFLYTSDQNRQIRMVDSFSNTLGFEKKLIESISYSDSWTVFIVA